MASDPCIDAAAIAITDATFANQWSINNAGIALEKAIPVAAMRMVAALSGGCLDKSDMSHARKIPMRPAIIHIAAPRTGTIGIESQS